MNIDIKKKKKNVGTKYVVLSFNAFIVPGNIIVYPQNGLWLGLNAINRTMPTHKSKVYVKPHCIQGKYLDYGKVNEP